MALHLAFVSLRKSSVKTAHPKAVTSPSITRAFSLIEVRLLPSLSFIAQLALSPICCLLSNLRAGAYGCARHLFGRYDIWFRADHSRQSQGQVTPMILLDMPFALTCFSQGGKSRNCSCQEGHSSIFASRGRSSVNFKLSHHSLIILMRVFSYCEQKAKFVSMEAKIMSNVPGWEAGKSVYHSERCVIQLAFIPTCCLILFRWVPYFEGSQRAKATPGW